MTATADSSFLHPSRLGRPFARVLGTLLGERHGPEVVRAMQITWLVALVILAVDLAWLPQSRLVFAPGQLVDIAGVAATLLTASVGLFAIEQRLASDSNPIAGLLRLTARRGSLFLSVGLAAYVTTTASALLCYLVVSIGDPLLDGQLASLDEAIGFDWLAFLSLTNASPSVAGALVFAYHSTGTVIALAALWLAATGQAERLAQYVAQFALTIVALNLVLLFVPAAGAYAHYGPDARLFSNFSLDAGVWHLEALEALRSAPAPVFELGALEPLVTFPSFHTICGVLATYAFRGTPAILLPAGVLNGVMIVSTIPEGGHYLVDVLAGAALAVGAILACRWLGRPSALDRPRFRPA